MDRPRSTQSWPSEILAPHTIGKRCKKIVVEPFQQVVDASEQMSVMSQYVGRAVLEFIHQKLQLHDPIAYVCECGRKANDLDGRSIDEKNRETAAVREVFQQYVALVERAPDLFYGQTSLPSKDRKLRIGCLSTESQALKFVFLCLDQ